MSHFQSSSSQLLSRLNISYALRSRIHDVNGNQSLKDSNKTFVLYLPTVNLRYDQNPAFALACHLSNLCDVPCVVLATVLDDQLLPLHMKEWDVKETKQTMKPIVMTSRRLAFLLEALSEAGTLWSNHGAGIAIRIHGPKCRSPDHLSLSSRATAVVTDEPFVHPFLNYVLQVERTCKQVGIPCFRVDGSTTVPPVSVLKRCIENNNLSKTNYTGVPSKAWMWQKQTESKRMSQIHAAMAGEFDAPTLSIPIHDDYFFVDPAEIDQKSPTYTICSTLFPLSWRLRDNSAPGSRPWSIVELAQIFEQGIIKEWSMNWPGADTSVKPCVQTVGSCTAGWKRWDNFVRDRKGLVHYGRLRGDPKLPHASSRMSCYLNFGIVSIFRIVHEVKLAQAAKVAGADKFEEEIVKWREMSYAHAFSRMDYNDISTIPKWAILWIDTKEKDIDENFSISNLDNGESPNEKWNAMQKYLIRTGELHNNVRMTWGKTVVEWLSSQPLRSSVVIQVLNYLNDRYALDGLSPPSYAGINWCLGWCDKQDRNGGITTKPASRYNKMTISDFEDAEQSLLHSPKAGASSSRQSSILGSLQRIEASTTKTKRKEELIQMDSAKKSKSSKTLHDFFRT